MGAPFYHEPSSCLACPGHPPCACPSSCCPLAVPLLGSVRLPKNMETEHGVVLGEGKPENQNAAVIFCFGEVVQVRPDAGCHWRR